MPYHWLDFTPPQPQIAAAPVEDFVTAASSAEGMPDADIADIHAYLSSVPKSPAADSIPILRDLKPGK